MSFFLYILAVLPALVISFLIYRLDQKSPETHQSMLICFGLGMLVTIPAMKVEELELLLPTTNGLLTLGALLFSTFILVALGEELFKALPLLFFAFPRKYFDEPYDGIVFAVMIAMGFALVENLFYAYQFGWQTTLVRAFTAVPAHGALAVIMGYHVGLAKFYLERKYQLIGLGFLQVILIHGLYDFFIIQEYNEDLMVLTAVVLTLSLYYAIRLIRKQKQFSLKLEKEKAAVEIAASAPLAEAESNDVSDAVLRAMQEEEE